MAKMEPRTRIVGYVERRMVSRAVGSSGDLRAVCVDIVLGVGILLEAVEDVGVGEACDEDFLLRCERRGVKAGESIL